MTSVYRTQIHACGSAPQRAEQYNINIFTKIPDLLLWCFPGLPFIVTSYKSAGNDDIRLQSLLFTTCNEVHVRLNI